MCLGVPCQLLFLQNDRDILRAASVTVYVLLWNGYRNKSQHGKLTLQMKLLPLLLRGLEPKIFRSGVRRSTTELSPLFGDAVLKIDHYYLVKQNNNQKM